MTTRCVIVPGGLESAVEGPQAALHLAEANSCDPFVQATIVHGI